MKYITRTVLLLFLFFSSIGFLTAQVPDGGIRLNAETGTIFQQTGQCTATSIVVSDQSFTEGIRIEVGSAISNTWDAQVRFPAIGGIENGDVLLVSFFARTIFSSEETGEGKVSVVIENNSSYAKEISYVISIGNEWKQYYASAISGNALSSSQVSYLFHCGFPDQIIEVADVQYLNYKQTLSIDELPETEITYSGQAPDASWRAPASERIKQIRKGVVDLTIYDDAGQKIEGANVSVEMVQHQFGFGTAIAASEFNSNPTYRNWVLEMFNEVVFENDLKWPQFNPSSTSQITRAMDSLDAHNIAIRGHNIIWPSWQHTPSYLESLEDDPVALRNAIDTHFDQVTQYTKGRLVDWDVMNEPYSEHEIQDILGNEIMVDWFNRTRQNDRNVKLYINEYSIISAGGKNTVKQDYYYNLIQEIEADGGQIDGIGIQGHMSSELTSITKVYDILERFAALGKEIKITEHDVDLDQRGVQADYTRDFMTILFSHSSVKSLLVWGFWESRHWKPDGAFFDADWTIRPHGEVWNDLIYNQWWTPETELITNAQGQSTFEGFLGKYKYTIISGDHSRSGFFTIDNSNQSGLLNEVTISMDSTIPVEVKISASIDGFLCEGETVTLSAPLGDGLTYTWYKDEVELNEQTSSISTGDAGEYFVKVSKPGIELISSSYTVVVNPSSVAEISMSGIPEICQGETVSLAANMVENLSYFWKKNGKQILANSSPLIVDASGSYSLVTTIGGCTTSSVPLIISVGSKPEAAITVTGTLPLCEGESVYMLGTIATSIDYLWYKDGVELPETDRLIEVFESGTYAVQTSIDFCSSLSEEVIVEVNPFPEAIITVDGELMFCEGGTVTLNGNSADNLIYIWMDGSTILSETDQSIIIEESGNYSLVTSLLNCSSTSDPVIVTVLPSTDPDCINNVLENETKVRAYPNPFRNFFMLETTSNMENGSRIDLYNSLGKLVYSKELEFYSESIRINVADPGLYLLQIRSGDVIETIKLTGE